jgi:ABC-type transporter Mla subunit MlaD
VLFRSKGSEVRIRDTAAGSVARIHPTAEGTIEATFELKESYHGFVRANSVAVVKKTLLVVGDSYVDISIGSRHEPQMPDGSRILCTADRGIAAQASQVLEELHTRGLPTLERLNAVLDKMPALMSQFRDTLRDAEVLFEGLQRHWMVRGYIKNTKPARPDPPAPGNPSPVGTK